MQNKYEFKYRASSDLEASDVWTDFWIMKNRQIEGCFSYTFKTIAGQFSSDCKFGYEVWEVADNQIETCVLGEMIWFANKEFHAKKKPGLVLHEIKNGGLINPSGFEKITDDFGHTFWKLISPDPSYKCLGTAVTPTGMEPSKIRYCCVYEKYLDQNHQISKAASTWKLGY